MLRITKTTNDQGATQLRLDGRVDEAMLAQLEQSVAEHRGKRSEPITLDFSGVVFIDDAGVKFLKKMRQKKVKIVNCSLFIKTLIGELTEEVI